jgi:hypothetical protein
LARPAKLSAHHRIRACSFWAKAALENPIWHSGSSRTVQASSPTTAPSSFSGAAIPYTDDVRIALAVQLGSSAPRLPLTASYLPPEALRLAAKARPPLVRIVAQEASAAAKVAVAVAAHARGLFRDFVKTE